jgi:hypothetical protein
VFILSSCVWTGGETGTQSFLEEASNTNFEKMASGSQKRKEPVDYYYQR